MSRRAGRMISHGRVMTLRARRDDLARTRDVVAHGLFNPTGPLFELARVLFDFARRSFDLTRARAKRSFRPSQSRLYERRCFHARMMRLHGRV
jgi:hypothetical protein